MINFNTIRANTLLLVTFCMTGTVAVIHNQASEMIPIETFRKAKSTNNETTAFTCICTPSLNGTSSERSSDSIMSRNELSLNEIFGNTTGNHLNLLRCHMKSIICRQWSNQEAKGNHLFTSGLKNNHTVGSSNAANHRIPTKPLSCVIIISRPNASGHRDKQKKTGLVKNEKLEDLVPTNSERSSIRRLIVVILFAHPTLWTSTKSNPNLAMISLQKYSLLPTRPRRSTASMIALRPMIFPYLPPNLVQRKRDREQEKTRNVNGTLDKIPSMPGSRIIQPNRSDRLQRNKRQTHVMIVHYRKDTEKKRYKREDEDDCEADNYDVSTTPYTYLNVSFTVGHWEFPGLGRTTMKPRVQRPLEMTENDMDFVYGNNGYENKNLKRKPIRGKSGGWSSSLTVKIHT